MARAEIDSFILKFKNLLLTGRSATLVIKSNAGKAEVSLNVELGHVPPPSGQNQKYPNGPSRQRRRLRRAASRVASKTEEVMEVVDEEVNAVEAIESKDVTEREALKDEFCSDNTVEEKADLLILQMKVLKYRLRKRSLSS